MGGHTPQNQLLGSVGTHWLVSVPPTPQALHSTLPSPTHPFSHCLLAHSSSPKGPSSGQDTLSSPLGPLLHPVVECVTLVTLEVLLTFICDHLFTTV